MRHTTQSLRFSRLSVFAVGLLIMVSLTQLGRGWYRSPSVAWAAGEPQATALSSLDSQLLFTSNSAILRRSAADFAGGTGLSTLNIVSDQFTAVASADINGCVTIGLRAAPRGAWVAAEATCGPEGAANVLQVVDVGTGVSKILGAELGSDSIFLGWSPNGNEVLVRADVLGNPQVYHIRAADGVATPLPVPSDTYYVDIAPNGTRMAYALTRGLGYGSELWIANLDGSNVQRLIADPTHIIAYARFSPNGQQIAYIRMMDSNIPFTVGELWVMNVDGSNAAMLGEADAGHGYEPAWSPDGTRLAFVRRDNPTNTVADQRTESLLSNIVIADVNTRALTAASVFTGGLAESPVWSPDGNTLAFAVFLNGAPDIWAYDASSQSLSRVTSRANAQYPTWLFSK
jgi:Tol biopolymer transport system component